MRCSPIALYTFALTLDEMKVICELSTKLTHTHIWGLVGALQQCYAIRLALLSTKSAHSFDFDNYFMDILHFVCECEKSFRQSDEETKESGARYANKCIQKNFSLYMEQKESYKENFDHLTANHNGENRCEKTYSTVLKKLYKLINKCRKGERINLNLLYKKVAGCGISAIESIPMALFAFIIASDPKCSNELNSKLNSKNAFKEYDAVERVILYAISFGGECSNKIASMAGAIAGAFFSKAEIPKYLIEMCESHRDVKDYAQKLFNSAWSSGKESNGNKDCKQSPVD
jgi:ADP-ribosylglycohydrolase